MRVSPTLLFSEATHHRTHRPGFLSKPTSSRTCASIAAQFVYRRNVQPPLEHLARESPDTCAEFESRSAGRKQRAHAVRLAQAGHASAQIDLASVAGPLARAEPEKKTPIWDVGMSRTSARRNLNSQLRGAQLAGQEHRSDRAQYAPLLPSGARYRYQAAFGADRGRRLFKRSERRS